jgi:signal transduction histidine kinase
VTRVPTWLDALAGTTFLILGVAAAKRSHRFAVLAVLAGGGWFAGDVAAALLLVHRPLMLHTAVSYPDGRVRDRFAVVVLAVSWFGALVQPIGGNAVFMLVLAVLLSIAAVRLRRHAPLGRRAFASTASRAVCALALSLAVPAAGRLWVPRAVADDRGLVIYTGLVTLAGVVLLVGVLFRAAGTEQDAVIELSEATPGATLAALRAQLADGSSSPALSAAAGLLEANVKLQSTLSRSVEEVRESRRRIIEAAVGERQRLEAILSTGAMRYLDELSTTLRALHDKADEPTRGLVAAGLAEVARSRDDLEQLARGLHPRVLAEQGLSPALADLAARSPLPVCVRAPAGRYPESVETAIWYACAEAVANLVKHARAGRATVEVTEGSGELVADIRDDGVGGARITPGGGLAGLSDRVGAVDGSVAVLPVAGGGTRVQIRVPLR